MASEFQVRLDFFAGPLDLLLHLVRRQEVTVEQVEMSKVAEQYLAIVDSAQDLDLELATEFLVVAATLVAIKSESVLPRHPSNDEADEPEADPYGELRERLRRYEIFKKRARELRALPQLGVTTFSRRDNSVAAPESDELEVDEEIQSIGFTFVRLLKRIGESVKSLRISLEPVSVVDCMMKIIDSFGRGAQSARRSFFDILRERTPRAAASAGADANDAQIKLERRNVFIGNFIALLELVKRGVLNVEQQRESADIALSMCLQESDGEPEEAARPVGGRLTDKIVVIDTAAAREAWDGEKSAPVEEELKEANRD